ncbi:MAG: hypothetical protein HZA90_09965 [Verrucomicrobia bacterium]|nr:hypothetical protein [Verrucomicrobiota bacterium]
MPSAGETILIVDDDAQSRSNYTLLARSAGYRAEPVLGPLRSIGQLLAVAKKCGARYALCDHRLSEGHYASFQGAEAVAGCNKARMPAAVLTTGYQQTYADTSIRKWRRWIPSLIPSTKITPQLLRDACERCRKEVLEAIVPMERRGCRAVLTVKELIPRGSETVVRVRITQWSTTELAGFPLSMVPVSLQEKIAVGAFLFASVNTGASSADDLFFENFELPHPDDIKAIHTQFGGR